MLRLSRIQKALWIAAILASFVFAILKSGLWSEETPPTIESADFLPQFSLPDSSGKLRDSEEFRGRWLLVFFGFTNCPDVCPTTLAEAAQVLDDLGPQAASVRRCCANRQEADLPLSRVTFILRQ